MSIKMLGETFDIHGGGMDLVFPHHENEIAQSETATGKPFAKYWLHNGLTRIRTRAAGGEWRDEKMSKSLGNIRGISELLQHYSGQTIRAFVLATHYRRPLDFSEEQLDNAARAMETFWRLFDRIRRATGSDVYAGGATIERLHDQARAEPDAAFVKGVLNHRLNVYEAMDDDFNTANALAALHAMAGAINRYADQSNLDAGGSDLAKALAAAAGATLVETGRLLGLFESPPRVPAADLDTAEIQRLLDERAEARKVKDFARADQIRNRLADMGIALEDTPAGTIWRKA
jgi:cysteinyl-tRNA synthetase